MTGSTKQGTVPAGSVPCFVLSLSIKVKCKGRLQHRNAVRLPLWLILSLSVNTQLLQGGPLLLHLFWILSLSTNAQLLWEKSLLLHLCRILGVSLTSGVTPTIHYYYIQASPFCQCKFNDTLRAGQSSPYRPPQRRSAYHRYGRRASGRQVPRRRR